MAGYRLSYSSKKTQIFQLSALVGCTVGQLTVLDVKKTPRKHRQGWLVHAQCKFPEDNPRWMPVGYLSSVDLENRGSVVLSLIEQRTEKFRSPTKKKDPPSSLIGSKQASGGKFMDGAARCCFITRKKTRKQTKGSIKRHVASLTSIGLSRNPYGRNPSKCNPNLLWYKRNGKHHRRVKKRNKAKSNQKHNNRRRSLRVQKKMQEHRKSVAYMKEHIIKLKDAYNGNVLSVYRSQTTVENETVDYSDQERDRISEPQAERLRRQCLAVIKFYELICENGADYNMGLCSEAAANSDGLWGNISGATVVKWEKEYRNNDGHFLECMAGKHDRNLVTSNEEFKEECMKFVKLHGKPKGKPNMTVADFQEHLNTNLLLPYVDEYNLQLPISIETARNYLHGIGVKYNKSQKGLYFDHHQREDVVKYRDEVFIPEFNSHLKQMYYWYSLTLQDAIAISQRDGSDIKPADLLHAEEIDMLYGGDGEIRPMVQWRIDYFCDAFREKHESEYPMVNGRRMHAMRHVDCGDEKPVIMVDQDECIYKSGDVQKNYWGEPGHVPTQAKTEGAGFMVSGYSMWGDGFVTLTEQQRRDIGIEKLKYFTWNEGDGLWYSYHLFDYGKNREGYWDGEKMSHQAMELIGVMEWMYPDHKFVFLYDWSTCHDKMATDSVHAKLFLKDHGFQKYGKDTADQLHKKGERKEFVCIDSLEIEIANFPDRLNEWVGDGMQYYKFRKDEKPISGGVDSVDYEGMPKGLSQLLRELGLYHSGLKRKVEGQDKTNCMTSIFMALPHIDGQQSILAQITEDRGHKCLMLPKFHCELNPMERRWGRSKWYTRRHCNSSLKMLRKVVLVALSRSNIPSSLSAKYERVSIAYVSAYMRQDCNDPFTASVMINAKKKFRSHRGIPSTEYSEASIKVKPWDNVKKRKLHLT